jgi:hypothetical protein
MKNRSGTAVVTKDKELTEAEASRQNEVWYKWGPYLSERQWGTVREDYSESGNAWDYFTHEQARSRAYRWGEDGIAGISDNGLNLCFALALWNGKDPILKERIFGLTNSEGNHGEDCKEYYYYLDSTPTHSYMKYLYKYPQAAYPYEDLIQTNRKRNRFEFEYELIDTGLFNQDRYFDVFVEYAKESPEDLLIQVTIYNRGPEAATLQVLPTLWFRHSWSWGGETEKPEIKQTSAPSEMSIVEASHQTLGRRYFYCDESVPLLFTENDTNNEKIFGTPNASPYVKDGINNYIVNGNQNAINPAKTGTKVSAQYQLNIKPGGKQVIRLRLNDMPPSSLSKAYADTGGNPFGNHFDKVVNAKKKEADEFYDSITPPAVDADTKNVMRQALAGMLWSKQYYGYDIEKWLKQHGIQETGGVSSNVRNTQWYHMTNSDIISMPDKWEYPWYAAWDLAFHTLALSMVDPYFAKQQLTLMLKSQYLHPSGQLPAYEWNFSDVNPPVHAWAVIFNYRLEKDLYGKGDIQFLENAFQKLLFNFTWWVNRKDRTGSNVFEGGFLGLDNIGIFDRSSQLPMGGYLEQADGTAWMSMYCQNMLEIAIELAMNNPIYEEMAVKFLEHFFWIANSMNRMVKGRDSMWDEEDGFYYDLLRLPDGSARRVKVRSMVGLLSLCASTTFQPETLEKLPNFAAQVQRFRQDHPELLANIRPPGRRGPGGHFLLSLLTDEKLKRVLSRMLDEKEFLSPYGIRALSSVYQDNPYIFDLGGQQFSIDYQPAESKTAMFGGNSNWRGPIWIPTNDLIIRALLQMYMYYQDSFKIECPTGSGNMMNLYQVSKEIYTRLLRLFTRDQNGRRPVNGGVEKFQNDPNWKDYILFYEYFHGDNGAGLGASHQTGWTGTIARLIQLFGTWGDNPLSGGASLRPKMGYVRSKTKNEK